MTVQNHPTIEFRGRQRTIDELEEILEDEEDYILENLDVEAYEDLEEIQECISVLYEKYELVKSNITWNGDDMNYQGYKRVLKSDWKENESDINLDECICINGCNDCLGVSY